MGEAHLYRKWPNWRLGKFMSGMRDTLLLKLILKRKGKPRINQVQHQTMRWVKVRLKKSLIQK